MIRFSVSLVMALWKRHDILRYCSVHLVVFCINLGVGHHLVTLGYHPQTASLAAFIVHVLIGYPLDKLITFEAGGAGNRESFPFYCIIETLGYSIVVPTLELFLGNEVTGEEYVIARFIAGVLNGLVAFLIHKYLTFRLHRLVDAIQERFGT